ncbi:MAG: hypothetical protein HY226_01345 [Candidatus Vogelbacteria bacterium]|nr:hypothetical protein [Candidatus Vogelbacteria bacterium]
MFDYVKISVLVGQTLFKIENKDDELIFWGNDGRKFRMFHQQSCCENVRVEDVAGELDDLIGTPILVAEERSQTNPDASESGTWTFYVLRTIKGSVTIRWYGSSSGYYSESVSFWQVKEDDN